MTTQHTSFKYAADRVRRRESEALANIAANIRKLVQFADPDETEYSGPAVDAIARDLGRRLAADARTLRAEAKLCRASTYVNGWTRDCARPAAEGSHLCGRHLAGERRSAAARQETRDRAARRAAAIRLVTDELARLGVTGRPHYRATASGGYYATDEAIISFAELRRLLGKD